MARQTSQGGSRPSDNTRNNRDNRDRNNRNNRDRRSDTFRVTFDIDEAYELRALLRDDEGDADEDYLDAVVAAMAPGANRTRIFQETDVTVTIRMSLDEKNAVRRAIAEQWRDSDADELASVIRKLDGALAKAV